MARKARVILLVKVPDTAAALQTARKMNAKGIMSLERSRSMWQKSRRAQRHRVSVPTHAAFYSLIGVMESSIESPD